MLALHKGTFQQTALLPHRACLGLQAVRQRLPGLPLRSRRAATTAAAAANILRSSADGESSKSSSSDKGKLQQRDQGDAQATDAGSTTPYPPAADSAQPTSSTPGSKLLPSASSSSSSSSKGSSKGSSSSNGGPEPPEMGGGPPSNLPPQLQRLLLLLTEFGGIYGTAAVAIAWFTHIDPFGNLHWSSADVLLGLATFAPLLALDALLMLPDYGIGPEDSQEVAGMFFGNPEALRNMSAGNISVAADPNALPSQIGSSSGPAADNTAAPGSSSSSSSSGNPLLRVRVALELLQQVYTRANPGIGLSPVAELAVVVVAVLADEMLYRAVGLTLLGLWVRDRLYEAGFDESVTLAGLGHTFGEMPTPEFARYAAVALVACLGIAGFAAGALREREALKRLQVLDKDGTPSEKADALKAQLVASIGSQNLVMYGVEGVREVTAAVMAGVAFVATGNLAAPLAGSMAAQSLFSVYQRYSLARSKKKRKALLGKMKQRSEKLQAAMKAALTAKKAAGPAADAETSAVAGADADAAAGVAVAEPASSDEVEADGAGEAAESSSSSSGSSGKQEDVDFLTLVLQAAEQQQEQEKKQLQQQQQQQQQQQRAKEAAAAASSSMASSNGASAAAEEGSTSVADWVAASAADSSSSSNSSSEAATGSSSSSSNGDGSAAAAEAAKQQLGVLLEDMLRSPEGFKVVQRWLQSQHSSSSSAANDSNGSGISSSADPRQAVEQLLADPEVKARLLAELQEQLCAMSDAQMRRPKQQDLQDTWRQ